jgi:RNA-binding protein
MLTTAQRQELRGRAHPLKPVVMIGDKGLVDTVMAEIDRALKVHELIKIRVLSDEREERAQAMAQICKAVNCEAVQIIGKLLVVYRERSEEETAQRHRMQVDRAKRARIRTAAKVKEAAEKAPIRAPARPPSSRDPRGDVRQNRGVNPRVTRGSVDGGYQRAERAPRPTTRVYTPRTTTNDSTAVRPARTSSDRNSPARAPSTRVGAGRVPAGRPARTTRPPRKTGY